MLEKIGLDLVRRYRKQTINLQENIYLFIFFLILIFIILYYIFICVLMYLFIYYPFNTETGCITIDYFTETVGYHKEKRDIPMYGKENPSLQELFKLGF